jgi:D-alanine-D-alanine ligase
MNKYDTAQFLQSEGFDVPKQYLVSQKNWQANKQAELSAIKKELGSQDLLHLIVKPADDGCSVMVAKIHSEVELEEAIKTLLANGKDHALIEECLTGMELTVGVIGNTSIQALPPSQALSAHAILSIEEKFLPGAGENQTPAPLPQTTHTFIKKTLEEVYKALGCKGYARIDCFYQSAEESPTGNERLVILEINTLPGLTPATCIFHQAAEIGLKPMEFIDLIVELGIEEHSRRGSVAVYSHDHSRSRMTMNPPALET